MQPIEFVNLLRRVYAKLKAPCSERQLNYLEKQYAANCCLNFELSPLTLFQLIRRPH